MPEDGPLPSLLGFRLSPLGSISSFHSFQPPTGNTFCGSLVYVTPQRIAGGRASCCLIDNVGIASRTSDCVPRHLTYTSASSCAGSVIKYCGCSSGQTAEKTSATTRIMPVSYWTLFCLAVGGLQGETRLHELRPGCSKPRVSPSCDLRRSPSQRPSAGPMDSWCTDFMQHFVRVQLYFFSYSMCEAGLECLTSGQARVVMYGRVCPALFSVLK